MPLELTKDSMLLVWNCAEKNSVLHNKQINKQIVDDKIKNDNNKCELEKLQEFVAAYKEEM